MTHIFCMKTHKIKIRCWSRCCKKPHRYDICSTI